MYQEIKLCVGLRNNKWDIITLNLLLLSFVTACKWKKSKNVEACSCSSLKQREQPAGSPGKSSRAPNETQSKTLSSLPTLEGWREELCGDQTRGKSLMNLIIIQSISKRRQHRQSPLRLMPSFINWFYLWMNFWWESWAGVQQQMFRFLWFSLQRDISSGKLNSLKLVHSNVNSVLPRPKPTSKLRLQTGKNPITWTNREWEGQPRAELHTN